MSEFLISTLLSRPTVNGTYCAAAHVLSSIVVPLLSVRWKIDELCISSVTYSGCKAAALSYIFIGTFAPFTIMFTVRYLDLWSNSTYPISIPVLHQSVNV